MESEYVWAMRALMLVLVVAWGLYLALVELRKRRRSRRDVPTPSNEKAAVSVKGTDRPPGGMFPPFLPFLLVPCLSPKT